MGERRKNPEVVKISPDYLPGVGLVNGQKGRKRRTGES